MKTISKLKNEAGLWISHIPMPKIKDTEVLIKIKKTAICGTDLHIYSWDKWAQRNIPVPMVVGHEFLGEVIEKGDKVTKFKTGDRVSGEGHITCNNCRNCRIGKKHLCAKTRGIGVNIQGAFAEYLSIPEDNVFKIPNYMKDNTASILDPFGNAVHTALSFDLTGANIIITGAGPIGIMATKIARHVGAHKIIITDNNHYRLSIAKKMGADICLNIGGIENNFQANKEAIENSLKKIKISEGFDVGLEMSGNSIAVNSMIANMKNGGKIAMLGISNSDQISIPWNDIVFKSLEFKGIYGREIYGTWYKMVDMVGSGLDISPVITHEMPVDEFLRGFELMKSGQCGKIILNW